MNVEIINVGTELLLGEIVNTNATYLQKIIKDLGFNIYYQTVVGDNEKRFLECLDLAFHRGTDMVITTGGLGPTADDVTKELSAKYLGLDLVYWQDEAKKVEDKCFFVSQYQDEIPESNYKQAYYPANAYILENEVGTANGCVLENNGKYIVNLPGPPKEMTYVVEHSLMPYLEKFRKEQIYTYDIVTMGIGESDLAVQLKEIIESQQEVTIALYASEMNVRIRLGVKALRQEEAEEKMKSVKDYITSMLSAYVLSGNLDEELNKVLVPYTINDTTDMNLKQYLPDLPGNEFIITITRKHIDIGDILNFTLENSKYKETYELHLLKNAEINRSKLLANFKNYILMFLRNNESK